MQIRIHRGFHFFRFAKRQLLYHDDIQINIRLHRRFYCKSNMTNQVTTEPSPPPYTLQKLREDFVAEVTGIDLTKDLSENVIESIKKDLITHKLLIFRDQGLIEGDIQLKITRYFGEVEDRGFDQHPKSPDRLILRVSNDENEGYRDFGSAGFHIDGTFMEMPNMYSFYHIVSNPKKGDTLFISLSDVLTRLPRKQYSRWDSMWLVKAYNHIRGYTDIPGIIIHPLVYRHPLNKQQTMCFAQGKTSAFVFDKGTNIERLTEDEETKQIIKEIDQQLYKDNDKHIYRHQWRPGDFLISDNLAVAHLASPETQLPVEEAGLRVMHRTIVKGTFKPSKGHARKLRKQHHKRCVIS